MSSNIERYKKDLGRLISSGELLLEALSFTCNPERYKIEAKKVLREEAKQFLNRLPSFIETYQSWYSESLAVIKIVLPDRINDFVRLYDKPKVRKEITCANYVIEDCLQGLQVRRGFSGEKVVGPDAAIPLFKQQLSILKSVEKIFESSLFDIKQLVQADLFDSELDAARELNESGFHRGAGAMAGVILEAHLSQVCENRKIIVSKKNPSINDFNQILKNNNVIETSHWRFIQHLVDLRNLCDHDKQRGPKKEEIEELINGVEKITKTIF